MAMILLPGQRPLLRDGAAAVASVGHEDTECTLAEARADEVRLAESGLRFSQAAEA
jgi:hypothetical protein